MALVTFIQKIANLDFVAAGGIRVSFELGLGTHTCNDKMGMPIIFFKVKIRRSHT